MLLIDKYNLEYLFKWLIFFTNILKYISWDNIFVVLSTAFLQKCSLQFFVAIAGREYFIACVFHLVLRGKFRLFYNYNSSSNICFESRLICWMTSAIFRNNLSRYLRLNHQYTILYFYCTLLYLYKFTFMYMFTIVFVIAERFHYFRWGNII